MGAPVPIWDRPNREGAFDQVGGVKGGVGINWSGMTILTHGSDVTIAPSVRPMLAGGRRLTTVLDRLASAGFWAVQLDATVNGLRPRDLDERGRRDLAAVMGRRGLRLAGLDCFIPPQHFTEPTHQDRAITAATAAVRLAADLGRVPLSIAVPVEAVDASVKEALVECAEGHGVRLAIHAEEQVEALGAWLAAVDLPVLGAGIDPAGLIEAGEDPAAVVGQLARRVAVARLTDVRAAGARRVRCALGEGLLDVSGYRVAVDLAGGRSGPVVLDVVGLDQPEQALVVGRSAWDGAAFSV